MLYYIWKKGDPNVKLTANFSTKEFECKGSRIGTEMRISKDLVDKLQLLRTRIGSPITITSGYRSPEHNYNVGGALYSQHIFGNAADITVNNINELYSLAEDYFKSIGDGRPRGFIHVDIREDRKRRWNY